MSTATQIAVDLATVSPVAGTKPPAYPLASRQSRAGASTVQVGSIEFGGPEVVVMAGPCTVESRRQLLEAAQGVCSLGAVVLRGGAFKPRTSPYDFRGLAEEGLRHLAEARTLTGLLVITEVMSEKDVELVANYADILQIGSRSMSAFRLLEEVARTGKPVMLKRGFMATVKEWLLAAEYILAQGNERVILCERGIRSFDSDFTRNTLDLNAVAVAKMETHLPVIVDPSHGTGRADLVAPLAKAAIAVGADGLLIEVHPDPSTALCDGKQSLDLPRFAALMSELRPFIAATGRRLAMPRG